MNSPTIQASVSFVFHKPAPAALMCSSVLCLSVSIVAAIELVTNGSAPANSKITRPATAWVETGWHYTTRRPAASGVGDKTVVFLK